MKKVFLSLFLALGLLVSAVSAVQLLPSPFDYPRAETVKLSVNGGNGSGVIIAPGEVLTASHVASYEGLQARDSTSYVITNNDLTVTTIDLGLLGFPKGINCPCVKLAEYEAQLDEPVIIVGYPNGITQVLTEGRSQGIVDSIIFYGYFGEAVDLGKRLVLSASADPGNSGGGVFVKRNNEWQLVGILVEKYGNISLAIPLKDIKEFLEKAHKTS